MQRFIFTTIVSLLSLFVSAQHRSGQENIECNLRLIDTLLTQKSILSSLDISPDLTSFDLEDVNRWAEDLLVSNFFKSGLELSGGYDYHLWNYNIIDDSYDGGDVVSYKHRFLISLKWNIMQSGLIGRDNFRQKVDILSSTKSAEVVNSMIRSFVIEGAERQIADLYGYYNVLIEAKAELYSALIAMQDELVANKKATMLSLSDLKIKRVNVLRMRKSGAPKSFGVIDLKSYVESQNLFVGDEYDSLSESNYSIIHNELEQKLIQNEADGISYWNEIKLSPYIRVSNYLDGYMNSKNVGNLGVVASFPIFTNTKSKRREVVSRVGLLANEQHEIRKDISFNIDNLLHLLNENFATLTLLVESTKYFSESCALATRYYDNNSMTIGELARRYVDNLDNNIEIYKLIIEREKLKYALFKAVYGV